MRHIPEYTRTNSFSSLLQGLFKQKRSYKLSYFLSPIKLQLCNINQRNAQFFGSCCIIISQIVHFVRSCCIIISQIVHFVSSCCIIISQIVHFVSSCCIIISQCTVQKTWKTIIISNSVLLKLYVNHFKVKLGQLSFKYTNVRDEPLEPVHILTQPL